MFGSKTVANDDRNVLVDRRPKRLRMNDLGAEIRQLHGFIVGKQVDDLRFRHPGRVSTHNTIYVCPDAELVSICQRGEYCCREVAAVAAECCLQVVRV